MFNKQNVGYVKLLEMTSKQNYTLLLTHQTNSILKYFIKDFVFQSQNRRITKRKSLLQTILLAYITIITFNYKTLCKTAFKFIHCVEVGGVDVLYIAGDQVCYDNWHYVNMIFLLLWVIPFPIALSTAYYLHKRKYINTSRFLVCVIFPISTIVIFCLARYKNVQENYDDSGERLFSSELFEIFEEPYRPNFFWWESYRLFERCFVAAIVTFYIDPVERTMVLSPIIVAFSFIHYQANPYKRSLRVVKMLDLVSNILLCMLVAINMFRAVVFTYNLPYEFPVNKASTIAYHFEYILTPIWVLVLYFVVRKISNFFLAKE